MINATQRLCVAGEEDALEGKIALSKSELPRPRVLTSPPIGSLACKQAVTNSKVLNLDGVTPFMGIELAVEA